MTWWLRLFINNKSRTCSSVGYRHGSRRLSCPWQQTLYRLFLIPNYSTLLYIEHLQIPHNEENEIIFIDWLIFLSNYSYLSGKCINFASKITDWLSYSWYQTIREFYNMLKISALRAYKAETHNLEVTGSSPVWSTKKALENHLRPFLLSNLFSVQFDAGLFTIHILFLCLIKVYSIFGSKVRK